MPKENLGKIGDYANVVSKNPKLLENCLKTKVYGDFPTKMIQERAKQLEPTKTPNSKEQLSFIIYCEKNIIKKIGKYFGLKTSLSKNVVTYLTDALHDGKSITPIVNSYLDKGIVPGRAKLFETLDNKTNKAN